MGIFFAPRQECPHLTKNNLKKCSLFLFFSEYKSEQEKRRKVQRQILTFLTINFYPYLKMNYQILMAVSLPWLSLE